MSKEIAQTVGGAWWMVVTLAAFAFIAMVVACGGPLDTREVDGGEPRGIEVIALPEYGVICFWKEAIKKAGLSCLPERDVEAPQGE